MIDLSDRLVAEMRDAPVRDWTGRAGDLEWSVERTLEHVAGSLGKYTLYLASRASRYVPLRLNRMVGEVTREDWLQGLTACARAFAGVAEAAPLEARAFHALGMADVEGYVALACAHVMEHAHDVTLGLSVQYTPPPEICSAVCARLYPWVPAGDDPWATFLWIVGKTELPGQPPFDQAIPPLLGPLFEWDGAVPRAPAYPVAAYTFDATTSRWMPVEHPG